MPKLLRLTLLSVFGAAGLGLAICLAMTSEPPDGNGSSAPLPRFASQAGQGGAQSSLLHRTGRDASTSAGQRWPELAPYHPAMSQQVEHLDGALRRMEELSQRHEQLASNRKISDLEASLERATQVSQQNQQNVNDALFSITKMLSDGTIPNLNPASKLPPALTAPQAGGAPVADPSPAAGNVGAPAQGGAAIDLIAEPLPMPVRSEGDDQLYINTKDSDIREILDLLSQQGGMNILASKSVQGRVSASLNNVDVDTALEAILRSTGFLARRDGNFVYVGTAEDFKAMDQAMDKLATRVYRPNYVTSQELQILITPMLTPDFGTISVSSASQVGIAPDQTAAGGDNFAGAEVLLVRDFAGVLAQIDQVVNEVDRRPMQVSIEAMILSVSLDDENRMGVDFEFLRDKDNIRLITGSPLNDLASIDVTEGGLKVGFLDGNLAAFVDALENIGDTNVIAKPRLMCLNKQRAEIHIGQEKGYISTTVTENAATQSVEFLEVGTQLRLRPFIANDGLIRMEVHPELSTGEVTLRGGFTVPDKNVTQVTTNVMVRDGTTMIIGGLIREDIVSTASQVPLVGSMPVVGPAFRRMTEKITRIETIILITPHIVYEPDAICEGERGDCEFHHRQAIREDKMSPLGARYQGERYLRLARAAWFEGNAKAALRFINLSIQYDPTSRISINLRDEIINNSPYGDQSVYMHLKEGIVPWHQPLRHRFVTGWMIDELGSMPRQGPLPAEMYDPGQPGYKQDIHSPTQP